MAIGYFIFDLREILSGILVGFSISSDNNRFMNKKDLILFLVLDVLAIITVMVGFRNAPSYAFAITLANATFVSLGLFVLYRVWKWADRKKSCTFYMAHLQFLVGVLPLTIARLIYMKPSSLPSVLGIPGPVFHRISEVLFMIYVLATLVDLVRVWRRPVQDDRYLGRQGR